MVVRNLEEVVKYPYVRAVAVPFHRCQCQCWLRMSLVYPGWLRKAPVGEDALPLLAGAGIEGYT